jgi:hypothetical protein
VSKQSHDMSDGNKQAVGVIVSVQTVQAAKPWENRPVAGVAVRGAAERGRTVHA